MKLLLDGNLSPRLVAHLQPAYPGSAHVRDVGLASADDDAIWAFARAENFTIVSKDSDFHQRSFLYGSPPKVIWVRLGNCTTEKIRELLIERQDTIRSFAATDDEAFLVLSVE